MDMLTFDELQHYLENLAKDVFVIALYINNSAISQDEWMDPLADSLQARGFLCVGILTPQSASRASLNVPKVISICDCEKIAFLSRINVFIVSDLDFETVYPQNSKILAYQHALELKKTTNLPYFLYILPHCDGWMPTFPLSEQSRAMTLDLWKGFHPVDVCHRPDNNFFIIPSGYPRLTVLTKYLAKSTKKPDAIIYAPQQVDYAPHLGGNRVKKHGMIIIRTLLRHFQRYTIIFRPYKADLETPLINEICASFKNTDRFILDTNTGREWAFSRGALLVTDQSHIAQTFSLSTLRPSVYFRPWMYERKHFLENKFRFEAYSFKGLISSVDLCLQNMDKIAANIRENRDSVIMPFEDSFENIASWIRDFFEGTPREEWLVIPRNDDRIVASDIEMITKLLKVEPLALPFASCMASIFRPKSTLLAAFALYMGKKLTSKNTLLPQFRLLVEKMLKIDSLEKFSDIEDKYIETLLKKSLLDYMKKKQYDSINIVENLLSKIHET